MTVEKLLGQVLNIVGQAFSRMLLAAITGFAFGALLTELLAGILNGHAGNRFVSFDTFPPTFDATAYTPFVHLMAILFGMVVAIMLVMWVLAIEAVHLVETVGRDATQVAEGVIEKGINSANAAVDALDGPDRHGFLGGQEFRFRQDQRR